MFFLATEMYKNICTIEYLLWKTSFPDWNISIAIIPE